MIDKLDSVIERYGNVDRFKIVDMTHQFPEWQEFYREGTSTQIPWRSVLSSNGREEMIPVAEETLRMIRQMQNIWGD